jgi:hypothetical protein
MREQGRRDKGRQAASYSVERYRCGNKTVTDALICPTRSRSTLENAQEETGAQATDPLWLVAVLNVEFWPSACTVVPWLPMSSYGHQMPMIISVFRAVRWVPRRYLCL